MLKVDGLKKGYGTAQGRVDVLRGLSFEASNGQTLALMGESGCGKSTLLHVIAGLDSVDEGSISIDGTLLHNLSDAERAALRRDRISLVFQQFNLITSLTVHQNLMFEAQLAQRVDMDWTHELTKRLELTELLGRYPEQLSGGQQQRVAIGRSLAARPNLILADEPTGNLDEANSDRVLDLAFDLIKETGATLIMATHSRRLAERADRTLKLSNGLLA